MTTKYEPFESISRVIGVFYTSACKSNGKLTEDLFHFLYEYLEGVADNGIKPVFPCSSVGAGKGTSFLQGTLLPLLTKSFPSETKAVLAAVNYSIERFHGGDLDLHDDYVNETYIAGFTDGDGTICSSTEYAKQTSSIFLTLAINEKPNDPYPRPYKEFLQNKSFSLEPRCAKRTFGKTMNENSAFKNASDSCLTLKLAQFRLNKLWVKGCNDAELDQCNDAELKNLKSVGERVLGILTSRYNNLHATGIPMEWFYERFTKMRMGPNPLEFLLYVAGIFGSVGCVHMEHMRISQSNESFIKALALAIKDACKFKDMPSISHKSPEGGVNNGVNSRGAWIINFHTDQTEQLIFLFGIFDYHRRSQWLICLIWRIVFRQHDFPNKKMFLKFLRDFLAYVKRLAGS